MKKDKNTSTDLTDLDPITESKKNKLPKKEKNKKRKAAAEEEDESSERSETSSELGEPVNPSAKKASKAAKSNKKAKLIEEEERDVKSNKKVKLIEDSEEEEVVEAENALRKFRISEPLRNALEKKGIKALFPIQALTFEHILAGKDLVGRARTGQGKTLAFVLPILESLVNGRMKNLRKTGYGRTPSVIVLLPTRELATQVAADFELYGEAIGLTCCCLYGGTPYPGQQIKLKRGVDIVVGTPGRVKDHIERGNIDFSSLHFRVLDEADEMLRMGFVEDVELILGKVKDVTKVQTILFSATLPDWVKEISSRFLKPDKKTVDLVSGQKMKASTDVRHIVIPCSSTARAQLIPDIIRCYSSGGRSIVFTETKDSASELAALLPGAMPLHGDIQQAQRDVSLIIDASLPNSLVRFPFSLCVRMTITGFKSGKFMTLVATNVAARGLDIDDVMLIIQCEPPRDVEAYIHRSGRTGRAGKTGVAVMLFDPRKSSVSRIERESGVKFEHLAAPQPADVAKAVGEEAAETISQISDSVIPAFKSAAEELLKNSGLSAVEILAKALAKASGYSDIKERSLLTSMENHVTLLLESQRPIYAPTFAFNLLRRFLPEEKVEAVKGLTLTADGNGAVFDVVAEDLDLYLAGQENAADVTLEVVKSLPRLQEREASNGPRYGRGNWSSNSGKFQWRGNNRKKFMISARYRNLISEEADIFSSMAEETVKKELRCQRIGCDAVFTEDDNPEGLLTTLSWSAVALVFARARPMFLLRICARAQTFSRASCATSLAKLCACLCCEDVLAHGRITPSFRDVKKEWTCCKKRSHDFALFLQIPGCKSGKHTTEKPVLAKSAPRSSNLMPAPVPVKASPEVASSKDACARCQQGFFCSDHGSQSKEISKTASNPAASPAAERDVGTSAPPKKIVDINTPQICRNKGCGETFKEMDNHDSACTYHPGPAVFRDRLRGWKCCDIHVKEFDEFIAIPPCSRGWHNADAS
ncbi:DEAD-box ATP-dependent RNA helicase 7-like protein [Drosera capensis]